MPKLTHYVLWCIKTFEVKTQCRLSKSAHYVLWCFKISKVNPHCWLSKSAHYVLWCIKTFEVNTLSIVEVSPLCTLIHKNIRQCRLSKLAHYVLWCLKAVFRIRIHFDPFHFGQPGPGSKKSAKILENVHKNHPKSQ